MKSNLTGFGAAVVLAVGACHGMAAPLFTSDGFESPHVNSNAYLAGAVTNCVGVGGSYNGFGVVGGLFIDGNVAAEPPPTEGSQQAFLNSRNAQPSGLSRTLVPAGGLSSHATVTLTEIIDRVNRSTESFKQVSESMQAQSEGAEQISEAMTSLMSNAQQTMHSVQESGRAAADLQSAIGVLRVAVSQFKLRE